MNLRTGYHAIPAGWSADEILASHRQMRGTFPLDAADAATVLKGSPEHRERVRYRTMLSYIAEGARAGDDACIELCVRFVELNLAPCRAIAAGAC